MKINKTILLGALTICALSANAKVMDSSVATVNSKPILSSQYDKMTKAVLAQYEQRAPQVLQDQNNVNALKEEVLNQMISEELMLQAAQKEGIKIKDSELAEAINSIKQRFAVDQTTGKERSKKEADAAFNAALKEEGMTYKQFENKTREQLAVRKMIDSIVQANAKKPTEEDVRNAAQSYAGKSEDELLTEILRMGKENKANGTLSAEQLKDFEARVSPLLNAEQKERLRKVLGMLGN